MAETQQRMSSNDAGNATGSSSKAQPARGVSDVPAVNLKINQVDLFKDLDSLVGRGRQQEGCSIGKMVKQLDEPLRNKLNEIFSSDMSLWKEYGRIPLKYNRMILFRGNRWHSYENNLNTSMLYQKIIIKNA